MTPEQINQALEILEEDKFTPIKVSEAAFIYDFLKEKDIKSTLEIGFAYGRSASHIMAATQKTHIVIDPFQDNYKSLGIKNMEKLGFSAMLDHRNDHSHNALPALLKENRKFEFIFIDGDHKFDGEFIDFYYSDLLIEQNGFILLHDTWMRSTRLVMQFIKKNRKDYRIIKTPLRNFALFQKAGTDTRNGMLFKEFYTFRSYIPHKIIMWLNTGKSNVLKKIVFKVKEIIK